MDNPLELPRSENSVECIHDYARDLAYGAIKGYWSSEIIVGQNGKWEVIEAFRQKVAINPDEDQFLKKWHPHNLNYAVVPSLSLLISFGYLEKIAERGEKVIRGGVRTYKIDDPIPAPFEIVYILTSKAFTLLEKPITSPSVFISYKQETSSALGLLIEARLKLVDPNMNIFIDKLLLPGDEWERELENKVRGSKYFICLICEDTLTSPAVQNEIAWAADTPDCRIIAICHNQYKIDEHFPKLLTEKHAITVQSESAKGYESAISDLLNSMGYSTY